MVYSFTNFAGSPVSTVNVGVIDNTTLPITLVGAGFSTYGQLIEENMIYLLENFSNTTAPTNPMDGQLWNNTTSGNGRLMWRRFSRWVQIATGDTTGFSLIPRLNTATAVDFTTMATTALATISDASFRYFPTGVMLVPNGSITATTAPVFNLQVSSSADVLANTTVNGFASTKGAFYLIQGSAAFANNGNTISCNVTTAATGGTLKFDMYVFAFMTQIA